MALWYVLTTLLLLAFILTSKFVPSFSRSGSGSGGGIENGQEYLVAPELADCPVNTTCDTLSSYSTMATTGLRHIVFSFLPGVHKLSQTWTITASSNVTIRGVSDSVEEDNEPSYAINVLCEGESLHAAIELNYSDQIVVEGMRTINTECPVSFLLLQSVSGATVHNVHINTHSYETYTVGIFAINVVDLTVTHSNFSNSQFGLVLENVHCGIVDDIVLINNFLGINVLGFYEMEGANSFLSNNYYKNYACLKKGNITLKRIFSQGAQNGFYLLLTPYPQWLNRYTRIVIVNTIVNMGNGGTSGITLQGIIRNIDINIQSVSINGYLGSITGIHIEVYHEEVTTCRYNTATVRIHNVTIENINHEFSTQAEVLNFAALSVYSFRNLTISYCTIKNNGVTGILLYDSTAFLQGNITLTNNSGINGGGMAFYTNSFMMLDSSTNLQVYDNTAEIFGGGMYVSQDLLWRTIGDTAVAYTSCFALSMRGKMKPIAFDGNRANGAGLNLYGGYVDNCILPNFNNEYMTQISNFGDLGSEFCNQTLISSDPLKLLPCNESCVDDSENSKKLYLSSLFPGQDFSLRIAAVGQRNGLTPAIILFSSNDIILDETSPDSTQSFDTKSIDAQCTTVTQTLALRDYVNETIIYITVADKTLPSLVNTPIEVCIGVLPCPPGFNLSDGICDCANSIQDLATCNITSESIQRNGNSWIYPRNDSIMIFHNCPFDYCNNKTMSSGDPDEQCAHNRAGILCGECIPGYSLILGSNECQNCTEQVWQLPLIVLGSVLAGIGLVAVLIAINLTVSVGTMNGLIFFVNIVKIYEPIFATNTFHPILQYFISWLNLDLGITSCFIPGMTACVKVGLQFVFPIYLLSIIIFIIVICKAGQWPVLSSSRFIRFVSGKLTLLFGSKAIPVLATLLLLSYTKLLRNTILIFHKATVIITDCAENTSSSTCENFVVWYVDGNINYTSHCHGTLFDVAVGIFSPLVVLFTSFLLFFPLMERFLPRFKCWSSWHMRLKPWYDAYGGPYKDEYRSWTGILLFVRCVLALVPAFENDPLFNRSVLSWTCLFLISLLSLIQVYKKFLLNWLEIMYLACLLLMVSISTPNDARADEANVVLGVTLCSLLLIALFHIYHQLVKLKRTQRLVEKAKNKIKKFRSKKAENESDQSCQLKESKHSTTIISLDSAQQCNECREPLLEQNM